MSDSSSVSNNVNQISISTIHWQKETKANRKTMAQMVLSPLILPMISNIFIFNSL